MSYISDHINQSSDIMPGIALEAAEEIERLEKENAELYSALENCRLLAARHRKEGWAVLILGFCGEGGVVGSVTR